MSISQNQVDATERLGLINSDKVKVLEKQVEEMGGLIKALRSQLNNLEAKQFIREEGAIEKEETKVDKIKEAIEQGDLSNVRDTLYENPVKEIVIRPDKDGSLWWDVRAPVMDFIIQLLTGYLWECKYGHMIAKHDERREVERILNHVQRLQTMEYGLKDAEGNVVQEPEWWPTADEEFDLLLVDFARLVPSMWD